MLHVQLNQLLQKVVAKYYNKKCYGTRNIHINNNESESILWI